MRASPNPGAERGHASHGPGHLRPLAAQDRRRPGESLGVAVGVVRPGALKGTRRDGSRL